MKDASQNAPAAARLLNPVLREEYVAQLSAEYATLRERNQRPVQTVPLEEAQRDRLQLF